ncbi:hypothetical protein BDC45DRAFT_611026 [Circinella umbellata]|nr:hypothetical protein BDC45DRAFT_611026 [Circinella umbellata]
MTERFREPMLAQIDLQDLLNNVPYSNDIDVKIPKAADIPRVLTNNGNPHLVKLSNMYRMHCASVLLYIQNGKIQQLNNFEAKFYKSFHFGECQHLCNDNAAVGRIMNHWELALNEAIIKSIYPQYSSIIPEDVLQLWNDQYFQRSSNNIYQLLGDLPLELRQQKRTNYDQLRQIFQTRQHLARYARNASISLLENHGKMTKFWNSLDLDSFVRMSRIENDCGRQRRLQWLHNVTNMLGEDINLEQWSVWLSNIIKEIVPLYFNQSLSS